VPDRGTVDGARRPSADGVERERTSEPGWEFGGRHAMLRPWPAATRRGSTQRGNVGVRRLGWSGCFCGWGAVVTVSRLVAGLSDPAVADNRPARACREHQPDPGRPVVLRPRPSAGTRGEKPWVARCGSAPATSRRRTCPWPAGKRSAPAATPVARSPRTGRSPTSRWTPRSPRTNATGSSPATTFLRKPAGSGLRHS
jgi:hypothetical protein